MKKAIVFLFAIFFTLHGLTQNTPTPFNEAPAWSKSAIWYQLFVERFNNGNPLNDPTPDNINIWPLEQYAPKGWTITPWGWDWYQQESWAKDSTKYFYFNTQFRRYGGDLEGVLQKLDYLKELGINALFFNPINDAPSLHKYDASYYHHVDVNFGPDPKGDKSLIAKENPTDPTTWQWTEADKLFLLIIQEAHKRGMHVIMDYSWNHTGVLFWAWQDILKNQEKSPYKEWYEIIKWDDPATKKSEFEYRGWANVPSLPEVKKVNVTPPRVSGFPYEGDINAGMKSHIYAVTKRWLAPNGDVTNGVDGFRLDVADQIGMLFWRDYRKYVRSINPDTYLVGEIWWQQWPDNLMNPEPYCKGDVFDAVMFYQVYRPARYFFAKTDFPITAIQFKDSLELQWNRLRPSTVHAMMNVSSSHDAPRLLTCFNNPNKYKVHSNPRENSHYKTGKPDPETYTRERLYLVHLFTTIGSPQIWNGEEMGMWGSDDPDCRKPLWWKENQFSPENRNNFQPLPPLYDSVGFNQEQYDIYKKLIQIRKDNPVLSTGDFTFFLTQGMNLGYKRSDGKNTLWIIFNLDSTELIYDLKIPQDVVDLLSADKMNGRKIKVKPLSAVILKKSDATVTSGQLKLIEDFPSKFVDARNINVWLPDGYNDTTQYAVVYMHDGQMLFDPTTTWNNQSWNVDEVAGLLMSQQKTIPFIIVGIWNNGDQRHAEYFPQKVFNAIPDSAKAKLLQGQLHTSPLSDNYLKFITTELKPFIDRSYSTIKSKEGTFIMGSSMGGLISLYGLCEYPDIFGGAACLSTHSPLAMPNLIDKDTDRDISSKFRDYLQTHLPPSNSCKIYMDYGDQTLDSHYKPYQEKIDKVFKKAGWNNQHWETLFFPGEDHSEIAWSKRLNIPFEFLLGKTTN